MKKGDCYTRGPIDIMILGFDEQPELLYITMRWWYRDFEFNLNFVPIHKDCLKECKDSKVNYEQYISQEALDWGLKSWKDGTGDAKTWFTVDPCNIVNYTMFMWGYEQVGNKKEKKQYIPCIYPVNEEMINKMIQEGKNVTPLQ